MHNNDKKTDVPIIQSINQSINHISVAPISPAKPGSIYVTYIIAYFSQKNSLIKLTIRYYGLCVTGKQLLEEHLGFT